MAEKQQRDTVEVRLIVQRFQHEQPDGSFIHRKMGDVFHVDRKAYDGSIEPDRGMGNPARSRTFRLLTDEVAKDTAKKESAQQIQDRIARMRESVKDQDQATERARAQARVQEAENARALAEAYSKPMERAGAKRVA